MVTQAPQIYLASSSPRRQELLEQIGIRFRTLSINIAETPYEGESPHDFVRRLALEKAKAGWLSITEALPLPVLGADTAVIIDDQILGKPLNREAGLAMLKKLSGRTHHVLTAVAIVDESRGETLVSDSIVTFRATTILERESYWETGEPKDKAGAYAIQGYGAIFIASLDGSYSGVMGLPLYETAELLGKFGISVL